MKLKLQAAARLREVLATSPTFDALEKKWHEKDVGRAYFQVWHGGNKTVVVSYEITFRRNTRVGAFHEYKSDVNRANAVLNDLAREYHGKVAELELCTQKTCEEGDERRASDGDSAYSEYEQSINGKILIKE